MGLPYLGIVLGVLGGLSILEICGLFKWNLPNYFLTYLQLNLGRHDRRIIIKHISKRLKKMNSKLKNWDLPRVLRLFTAVGFGAYAILSRDYFFFLFTGLFLIQAIFNISCCGASGCSTNNNQKQVYKDVIESYKPGKNK